MFLNYLKTAFRMMTRQKMSAIINISGLALGLASALFIFMYIFDEFQYDQYHKNRKTVFRVIGNTFKQTEISSSQPAVLMPYLLDNIPEIEKGVRFQLPGGGLISRGEQTFIDGDWVFADTCVFELFSWNMIRGNPATALKEPLSVIITEQMASKYFGDEDPIGQTLTFENALDFVITGVMESIPLQSHFNVNFMASMLTMETINPHLMTNWGNFGIVMFLKLHQEADPDYVSKRITEEYWLARTDGHSNSSSPDGPEMTLRLQALEDIYLGSGDVQQLHHDFKSGNKSYLYIFSAIAILILLIACFNYMNLATARSLTRAREVGLRKVLGSHKGSLIRQFMTESFLYVLFAVIIALILVEIAMPAFNSLTGKELSFNFFTTPVFMLVIAVLILVVTLMAGSYPSFVLASFEPVFVLKGASAVNHGSRTKGGNIGFNLRKMLITLQFVISMALIICSIVIAQQMYYLRNENLGFQKDQLLAISQPWDGDMNQRYERFRETLLSNPRVLAVSAGHNTPGAHLNLQGGFRAENQSTEERRLTAVTSVDWDYFSTIGAEFVAGRDFLREHQTDLKDACIINETAARLFELDDPVGQKILGFWDGNDKRVVGVIRDVQHRSQHNPPQPLLYYLRGDSFANFSRFIILRLSNENIAQTLSEIETDWSDLETGWPLTYTFTDELFERHYKAEQRTGRVVGIFATLAVLLSFMGLLGLVSFIVQARTREFGIRKVLGASIASLNISTAKEFAILVMISAIVAWPISWYLMNNWLQNFAGRIDISLWVFALAALVVTLLTLAITFTVTWRAASRNPVEAIKYE
jgi:putative ABC transport system permease protein